MSNILLCPSCNKFPNIKLDTSNGLMQYKYISCLCMKNGTLQNSRELAIKEWNDAVSDYKKASIALKNIASNCFQNGNSH